MINRILLAYDGSAPADKAYSFALDIAKKYDADLYVLAVARPPEFGDDVETEAVIENSRKHYQKVLAPLKALSRRSPLHQRRNPVRTALAQGPTPALPASF